VLVFVELTLRKHPSTCKPTNTQTHMLVLDQNNQTNKQTNQQTNKKIKKQKSPRSKYQPPQRRQRFNFANGSEESTCTCGLFAC
jgi:hypothetical protein